MASKRGTEHDNDRLASDASAGPPRHSQLTPGAVILWCLAAGLVTGMLALAARAGEKLILDDAINESRQVVWMGPMGDAVIFGCAAVLLLMVSTVWGRARSARFVGWCAAGLTILTVVQLPGRFHWLPALMIAASVGWVIAGVLASDVRRTTRIARWTLAVLSAVVLALAGIVNGWEWLSERRAIARLPAAPDSPNVILLVWDTARRASLSLYGYAPHTTPNLEALAADGTVFDRAISASPWSLTAHASMFTGQLPFRLETGWLEPLDQRWSTLAEVLASNGYMTAGFSANTWYADWEHGLAQGFAHYEDYPVTIGQMFMSTTLGKRFLRDRSGRVVGLPLRVLGFDFLAGREIAASVNARFLRWLDQRPKRPYFAFINYFDAHRPYHVEPRFAGRFGPLAPETSVIDRLSSATDDKWPWDLTTREKAAEQASYEAAIAYMDEQMGELVRQLRDRGELDRTLLIVTADHGEEFGEHGSYGHGTNLYPWQLRVPLVLRMPGTVPAGVRVSEPISTRQLAATVIDLTGVRSRPPLPGTSLARTWNPVLDTREPSEAIIAKLAPNKDPSRFMVSIWLGHWSLVRQIDGREEIYDMRTDTLLRKNAIATDSGRAAARRLATVLDSLISLPPRHWPRELAHPGRDESGPRRPAPGQEFR